MLAGICIYSHRLTHTYTHTHTYMQTNTHARIPIIPYFPLVQILVSTSFSRFYILCNMHDMSGAHRSLQVMQHERLRCIDVWT